MNIVVLTGSPRVKGNSNYLADQFRKGAEEAGHEVFTFDCTKGHVKPCLGCDHCGMDGDCVQKDEFSSTLMPRLLTADMIVFASPMYYFGFSAQLKATIDRFYARTTRLTGGKKTAFLMTYANPSAHYAELMQKHYEWLADYMQWENCGMVIAKGIWQIGGVNGTKYAQQAYELGKNI